MVLKLAIVIYFVADITLTVSASAKITLYGKNFPEPVVIDGSDCPYGSTFDADSSDFSCACMKGLWALYDNTCGPPKLVTGGIEEKCIQLKHKVRKVHLLSSPGGGVDAATIFSYDMKAAKIRLETGGTPIKHDGNVKVIATGTKSWGLKALSSCLAPEIPDETLFGTTPQYCTFAYNATKNSLLDSECEDSSATTISPLSCTPFLEASVDCTAIVATASKGRSMKAPAASKTSKGRSAKAEATKGKEAKKPSSKGRAAKKAAPPKGRMAKAAAKGKAAKASVPASSKGRTAKASKPLPKGRTTKQGSKGKSVQKPFKGRVFLDVVKGLGNITRNVSALSNYDIDKNLTVNISNPVMNSELWNYLTTRAQSMLNLTIDAKPVPLTPSFRFLDLAKQILQKACPDSYVSDDHFDMALGTFKSLQTKQLNFKDKFSDYATALRIEESLKFCRDNMTTYPFIDPSNRTKETCNKSIEMGMFEAFGEQTELVLPYSAASRENEPIVETVWKIFTHAHAACYNHFSEAFNDHHRFTSVLMPLFTNGINDIWNSVKELQPDTYSGLLGDAVKLMDGVAYCSEFSRLDTPYPWELPRPLKDPNSPAVTAARKRRAAPNKNVKFTCLKKAFDNKC